MIKAYLNLHAVLQNLEDLVKLDEQMAQLIRDWELTVEVYRAQRPVGLCGIQGWGVPAWRDRS